MRNFFPKQNEASFIQDQYCHLADDGSPLSLVCPKLLNILLIILKHSTTIRDLFEETYLKGGKEREERNPLNIARFEPHDHQACAALPLCFNHSWLKHDTNNWLNSSCFQTLHFWEGSYLCLNNARAKILGTFYFLRAANISHKLQEVDQAHFFGPSWSRLLRAKPGWARVWWNLHWAWVEPKVFTYKKLESSGWSPLWGQKEVRLVEPRV